MVVDPTSPETPVGRLVTVFGAAGFIGRPVVDELVRRGWRVRAFVRTSEEDPFSGRSGIEVLRGDVRDGAAVMRALAGALATVNLAGAKSDEPDSEATNVGGARNIAEAARANGGVRIVHFSTQAVKIARQGLYARTKLAADRVFEASGLPFTILRPSIAYGPGASGVFASMHKAIARLPFVPVLGDGRWISAPVHVTDLAHAVANCLDAPATLGRCYDLGGPDPISLDDLLDRIAARCGRRCRKVHIPLGLALCAARIAASVLPRPPVSVSNVLGSNQEIPIDCEPARRDFGFEPMSLEEGLRLIFVDAREPDTTEATSVLATEARDLARYLLGVEVEPEIRDRYIAAARTLFAGKVDGDIAFVRRHRWALSAVDAATAAIRPRSQVRQRVLLMAALLEASPHHADFYLAPPPSRARLFAGLAGWGLSSAAKLLAGLLLLPFIPNNAGGR